MEKHIYKLEYFIRPIQNIFLWIIGLLESLLIYCICTQYLVGAPLALNYCLNSAWYGGDQFVALLRWFGSPGFFDSGLQLHFLVSCFSFSSWQYPIDSLWGSDLVSLLASQAHQHHGHLTNFWCFWQCGQVPNPAGKRNQHLYSTHAHTHTNAHAHAHTQI